MAVAMADSPAEGQPAAVQAAFVRLRERFVAGLPQRWQDIEAAGGGPALASALHRLVGAAASYGLLPLGEAARRAETLASAQALQACAASPSSPGSLAPSSALAAALADLRRCIDDAVTVR
jgi:HPt (histidine-containing phosphotransfer) domain-containing protein